jgi:hypothetical protein
MRVHDRKLIVLLGGKVNIAQFVFRIDCRLQCYPVIDTWDGYQPSSPPLSHLCPGVDQPRSAGLGDRYRLLVALLSRRSQQRLALC